MRNVLVFTFCVFAYLAAGIYEARAQESEWTLLETTGSVVVHQSTATVRNVSLRETIAPGATLTTGGDGRAVLGRGAQNITIGPNARIVMPAADAGGITRFVQELGTALFNVDKREVEHFEVDTPLIAAVVKGTTFTVSAGAESHAVHVFEGLVQVTPRFGGAVISVPAGQTAIVTLSNPTIIELVASDMDTAATFGGQTRFAGPVQPDTSEDGVSGSVDNGFATEVEDRVLGVVDNEVLREISDSVLDTVGDEVFNEIERGISDTVENEVLGEIEDGLLDTVEDEVLGEIEDGLLDTVEDEVLGEIEDGLLDTVEDEVLGEIEDDLLDAVEDEVLGAIEDDLLDTVEDEVLDEILGAVVEEAEDEIENEILDGILDLI
jgi:hypothetical protein